MKKTIIENNNWETIWTAIVRDAKTYEIKRIIPFENVVLDQYKERVAKALSGDLDETGDTVADLKGRLYLRYEQLGTSDQTAVSTDTDLISEDASTLKQIASMSQSNNEVNVLSFWDDGEAIGNWREFALYANNDFAMVRANIEMDISAGETITIHGEINQSI